MYSIVDMKGDDNLVFAFTFVKYARVLNCWVVSRLEALENHKAHNISRHAVEVMWLFLVLPTLLLLANPVKNSKKTIFRR